MSAKRSGVLCLSSKKPQLSNIGRPFVHCGCPLSTMVSCAWALCHDKTIVAAIRIRRSNMEDACFTRLYQMYYIQHLQQIVQYPAHPLQVTKVKLSVADLLMDMVSSRFFEGTAAGLSVCHSRQQLIPPAQNNFCLPGFPFFHKSAKRI